jgi:aminomethyltransferase
MAAPRRHTPYYHKFVELGAELVDRIGFDAAFRFTTVEDEHMATRQAAGMYDVYHQGPIDVKGPDAEALLQRVLVRDVARRLVDGRVMYSSLCNPAGGMIDDLTCYRHSAEHFWLVPTPSRVDIVEGWLRTVAADMRAYVTNLVPGTAYLSIQGPSSRRILAPITDADLSSEGLPYFRFVAAQVAGISCLVSRTGYSGELGYELFYSRDYSEHVWDGVRQAGSEYGLQPCGLGALRSVRIEKMYPLYGLELTEGNSPLEARLGWAVDLDKADFIGRDVLLRQRQSGTSRLLLGIGFDDLSFVAASGDEVTIDGEAVGAVTSGDRGYFVGRSLALAYVAAGVKPGARVTVSNRGSGLSATGTLADEPFYDPQGVRVRS